MAVDWVAEAKRLFRVPRPEHFTNYTHCCECQEHDETLRANDIDTIGMDELGSPAWDPICFATNAGKHYYLPALVRLSLDTVHGDCYFSQLLFHLQWDGPDNDFFRSCNEQQRAYVARFIEFMIDNYPDELEAEFCADDALSALQIWSASGAAGQPG